MDCNKDEAVRAKQLAEMKMKNNDFVAARKIIQKAQNLCPELENISQLLSICDVHCSAQNLMPGSEKDWYGVLQVERFADEMIVKKQYRRLALFLHPDKNPFPGAEAAFKLICEANTVLSDPQKKSLYDSKIRVMVRSAQVVRPPHHSSFQVNKKYAEMKVSNGYRSMNQHQTTQSSYSTQVFCTSCPYCSFKYRMDRKFVNKILRCQKCFRDFTGHETDAQGVPLSNCVPESSQNGDVQNGKGYSASYMGSQWCANKQTGQPQAGVRTESIFKDQGVGRAAKVSRNVKAKRKDSGSNNEYGGKEGGTCNGYPKSKESSKKNKRKGRRRAASESSESDDTSSESDLEDVAAGCGVATNLNSRPTRRSSRKRQNISYTEDGDDDDDDVENRQNHAMDGESAEHGNQNGLNTDADLSKSKRKETGSVYPEERPQDKSDSEKGVKAKGEDGGKPNIGDDTVDIEIDSDRDADFGDDSYKESYQCADPEFNNFDWDVSCFAVNQYWSCYDSADGMPRFYAKVKKVRLSPFELSIAWLEADSADDTLKKWIDAELPVGCGTFRVGKTQKISGRDTFAQQVHCEKGKRGSLIIHPGRGEVWALFRDWDLSWSSQPDSHREFKYEVVEVLSDFDPVAGVRVCYLDKVEGFVSLFQRSRQSALESFMITPKEIYRLSHCIRSFKMTGSERGGVPVGSFELDPAALPLNPDHLYYPAKSKMETDHTEPGVNCAPPKSDIGKGNF